MSALAKTSIGVSLFVGLVLGLSGCGAGSNNDQGRSVRLNRFCADGMCTLGESGKVVPLATDSFAFAGETGAGQILPLDGQAVPTFIEVQNLLTSQFFRVDRIDCSYTVPGSDPGLVIPDDSFGTGAVLESPGVNGISTAVLAFEVITPDFFAFLNANRNSLPLLPFRTVASCSVSGVTEAGDTLTSNQVNYTVQFGEVAECCTGAVDEVNPLGGGFQQGPGTGGTLVTTGDGGGNAGGAAGEEGEEVDMMMEEGLEG